MRLTTHNGGPLFGQSDASIDSPNSQTPLATTPLATIVADELLQLTGRHHGVVVDQWVLLPNALHALMSLEEVRHSLEPKAKGKPRLLTSFVAELKAVTAKRINLVRNQPGSSVWRRSYNEQLVEDEIMLARLRKRLNEAESIVLAG